MHRCIQLAKNSLGTAAPNPMVGCVVVIEDKVIGEGYTSPYGGPHAEVNAIQAVSDKSLLAAATLYVSLEPCSHFGKTPPCVDLILKHNIPKVIIGTTDSNTLVAGQGIEKLRSAGCEVVLGILESECRELNRRFFMFHQQNRPYIILKWAQSSDGFLAPDDDSRVEKNKPFWISNLHSRQLVHQWRTEEQAVLVGTRTVLLDNPRLNVRDWVGKNPLRIVLDRDLAIPPDFHIMDKSSKTLVLTSVRDKSKYSEGIEYAAVEFSKNMAEQIAKILHQHDILSVIIEGGFKTLMSFINSDLWDEARIFTGQSTLISGTRAPKINGTIVDKRYFETDELLVIRRD